MKEQKYIVVHATATDDKTEIDLDWLDRVHKGPADQPNGKVIYLGKTYANRQALKKALPNETQGGVSIHKLKGRGWRRRGYRLLIQRSGNMLQATYADADRFIEEWEISNGVAGINDVAGHIVMAGGIDANDRKKAKNNFTPAQFETLKCQLLEEIKNNPKLKVGGHNQFANKACPCFDVPTWLESIGFPEENIYRGRYGR